MFETNVVLFLFPPSLPQSSGIRTMAHASISPTPKQWVFNASLFTDTPNTLLSPILRPQSISAFCIPGALTLECVYIQHTCHVQYITVYTHTHPVCEKPAFVWPNSFSALAEHDSCFLPMGLIHLWWPSRFPLGSERWLGGWWWWWWWDPNPVSV